LTATLCGCGPKKTAFDKQQFILESSRGPKAARAAKDILLDVSIFTVDTAFDSRGLMYRKSDLQYESDYYNEFIVSPGVMISGRTRAWLSESGLFKEVLNPGTQVEPTHTLEGNIIRIYGDFREEASADAVLELRVFLVDNEQESVIFSKTYNASSELATNSAQDMVEALDRCLRKILTNLEEDLDKEVA
jgi:ABC-type uncharacterized transport system auxiliary subunit